MAMTADQKRLFAAGFQHLLEEARKVATNFLRKKEGASQPTEKSVKAAYAQAMACVSELKDTVYEGESKKYSESPIKDGNKVVLRPQNANELADILLETFGENDHPFYW